MIHVYRCFDADDRLLYVGQTQDVQRRVREHRRRRQRGFLIERVETEEHTDRLSAVKAEKRAIATERPLYNVRRSLGLTGGDGAHPSIRDLPPSPAEAARKAVAS